MVDDPGLPGLVRREADLLKPLVATKPVLVWERLEELRLSILSDLPLIPPTADYARCVSVEVFWRYHLRSARRGLFRTAELYKRHLESLENPAERIWQDLKEAEPLVPAPHSWLIPVSRISGLDGAHTKLRLRIDQYPPYIVMVFPVSKMKANGVEIREPRGVDVVPGRLVRWSPGDVLDERIDQDIPTGALGAMWWRP